MPRYGSTAEHPWNMGWRTVILVERHIDGQGLINANHFMFPHGFVRLDSSRLESV